MQEFQDLDLLSFPHRQVTDLGCRVDLHAVLFGKRGDFPMHTRPVQPDPSPAEKNVFGYGHSADQLEVLIDHADPGFDRFFR